MNQTKGKLRWLLPFFKPYRFLLFIVLCLALISTALELSYPFLSKVFIDDVLLQPTYSLKSILILTFTLMVGGIILQAGNSLLYLHVTLRIVKSIRLHVFNHLERLSYKFFLRTRIGDITTRLNGDINIVQSMLTDGVLNFIIAIITFIIITTVLIYLHWKLFLITLFIFPLLTLSLIYFRPLITNKAKEIREKQSDIQAHMIETFSQIRLVKLLVAEKEQSVILDNEIEHLNKKTLQYAIVESLAGGIPRILTFGMTSIILFIGGIMVLNDELTVGSLLAFTTYLSRYFSPVQTIAGLYIRFHTMLVSLRRLTEYLEEQPEHYDEKHEKQVINDKAELRCHKLSFTYKDRTLFNNVSLQLKAGNAYALAGPSGSGKSTFIDLLVNLRQPTTGTVYLNDQSIYQIPVNQLRKNVFVVPQDIELIHQTVKENLLFSLSKEERTQMTDEQIKRVCQYVNLHEEIMRLPEQYNTVLGEQGRVLSGGQKQRLSIARGLLRDPTILILDEATSGLDYRLEQDIFNQLQNWLHEDERRMLMIVSHRLHSLQWVDEWLVIENEHISKVNKLSLMSEDNANTFKQVTLK